MDYNLTLDDLFNKWQNDHKTDVNFNKNCTLPKGAEINFIPDGRFDETKTGGILFICKESNVENDTDYGTKDFWMKNVVNAKSEGEYYKPSTANDKRAQTKYYNCLQHIIDKINNKTENSYKIEDCAYMNINKRGGKSISDNEKIKNYFNQYYQDFIREEIKLLKCDYIVVFCYEQFKDSIITKLQVLDGYADKVYGYQKHPSRYSKDCTPTKLP